MRVSDGCGWSKPGTLPTGNDFLPDTDAQILLEVIAACPSDVTGSGSTAFMTGSCGGAAVTSRMSITLTNTVFLSVFHMYATMLVGTVARLVQNENGNCHVKTCAWHAGMNTANVNVTDGALSATRKAYGVTRAVETTDY